GVEFDLIYDPVGFLTLFANLDKFKNEILYIHQGGILGNISQKMRYERKINKIF
ncbi:MAG: 1-aminocyclopropane-1-carboxylate deaminase, partial [Campylobacter sp.]|nr:1-aminocyclopropane-1-carboxylate deaminase [Campylobacter sp.]